MLSQSLLVLANPAEPQLAMLSELPDETSITIGETVEAFVRAAPEATVIFNWSKGGELLEQVFSMAPKVCWVHVRSAGLDGLLSPALVVSPVPLTNGRGAFSESLGEFAIGAALFFAKDFRRMVRSQEAGRWDQFDVAWLAGAWFATGALALRVFPAEQGLAAVWPASGVALGVLLLHGVRAWPGIAVGSALLGAWVGLAPSENLALTSGNVLEAVVGARLALWAAGGESSFRCWAWASWPGPAPVPSSARC